ncbi:hypothetical protein V2J09_004929 [Rumex salicifolius]
MDPRSRYGGLRSYEEVHDQDAEQRGIAEWLNSILPNLNLPIEASEAEIRACLLDGSVLCCILNKLIPGSVEMEDPQTATVWKFLLALDRMGLPGFAVSDLEQGSLVEVFQCLQSLREYTHIDADREANHNHARKRWNQPEVESLDAVDYSLGDAQQSTKFGAEKCRNSWDTKYQTVLRGPEMSEVYLSSEAGNKLSNVFQTKKGLHGDTLNFKISDLMKWNSLDKAPMQLLFSIVDKVLNESLEKKNGDVPHSVAYLLRKLVREIERRISSQGDKIKKHNSLVKSCEGKYQLKFRALETLAVGAVEETQVLMSQLQMVKADKLELEEKKKHDEQDVVKLVQEIDLRDAETKALKKAMEETKISYENQCMGLETKMKETRSDLEKKIKELDCLLKDSKNKVEELEQLSEIERQRIKKKELLYKNFLDTKFSLLQGLRLDLDSVRIEALRTKTCYSHEFHNLGMNLKELVDAAENYHMVLSENRKLYNEVQDLKGNIRVYCRIRPFLRGQSAKQTTIEYIGENGELVVTNPSKQGKDNRRLFKFNKVFGQAASQEEIFKDTQPLIRSVLDGYNVCIFAYGQTGSGKTYTMSGPNLSSVKDWGVNYRALHDLFQISQSRRSSILYEVGVQMVEIYNEQVRDLLANDGILSTAQPNGLSVPEASMHPVKSTNDVLELMNIGLMNRAVGATALNERSSRSHSILTVHVRGTDLKSNSVLRGCLHLVDLAGSERVDRSEATGDRLREAQHINKSLSALGDVIFALAQKNSHVPYRNSKLTQVLQSSLGGQAKTLMFVQLNPDLESHSETVSTLKFAERVSGVELGAARSNKEGRDLRDLMEQVSFLKDVIVRKDEVIEHLRLTKANDISQKGGMSTVRGGSLSSPSSFAGLKNLGYPKTVVSDPDNCSESSDKHSEDGSQHLTDVDILRFGNADSEKLSDISDGELSIGAETDCSMGSALENTLLPEVAKQVETDCSWKSNLPSKLPKPLMRQASSSSMSAPPKASAKVVSSSRKAPAANGLLTRSKAKPVKGGSKSGKLY